MRVELGSSLREAMAKSLSLIPIYEAVALVEFACLHDIEVTRASRSTCTPRKHYCEMTDNTNAHVDM